MIRKLLYILSVYKFQFAGALLLATATILTGVGLMSSSGYLISRAAERPLITDLFMITAAVRFFGISRAVVRYFERLVSHDLTFKILLKMRDILYRTMDALPPRWIMGNRPGDLLSRVVTDIETLQNFYLRILAPVITASVVAIITCLLLQLFDYRIALTTFSFLFLSGAGVSWLAVSLSRGRGKEDVKTRAGLKVFLVDKLQGMQDLLWLGQRKRVTEEFAQTQDRLDRVQKRNASDSGLLEGLNTLLAHMGMISVLFLALPLIMTGEIRGVMLAMLTLGVLSSFEAVQGLAGAFLYYENSRESAERLFSIVDTEQTLNSGKLIIQEKETVEIEFRDVYFSYDELNVTIQDFSMTIPEGTRTAVVGPTGSGKSTLLNLLMDLWRPDHGSITLGGREISELDKAAMRSLFGVMMQDDYLFNRSLRENLLIARPDADDMKLARVLAQSGLESFASSLDNEAGNQGMRFSGGERQKFALARVFLKDAPVWILDEPTAHMDARTERQTLDSIWSELKERSLMLITHRLVDMERMDQIIVLNRGMIIEKGNHIELLKKEGFYARMYGQQQEVLRG